MLRNAAMPFMGNEYTLTGKQGQNMSGLAIAGVVVLGLGVVAWFYLGDDLRRYIRIRNM
jgi:hypothetical protein